MEGLDPSYSALEIDPHVLEFGKRRKDRIADPHRVLSLSLWGSSDLIIMAAEAKLKISFSIRSLTFANESNLSAV